jgi:activating signal cointegrator complex subunit 3
MTRTDNKKFEEVSIPAVEPAPMDFIRKPVAIDSLDDIGRAAFAGTKALNRIQSVVFETAYNTGENMLVCAPTGAGKACCV